MSERPEQTQVPKVPLKHKRLRGDKWVDAVTIDTVPRYKTSGLSGDEWWRFSFWVRLWRKGYVVGQESFGSMEYASAWLTTMLMQAAPASLPWPKDAPGQPYGDGYFCDNLGCSNVATWRALMKIEACREGHKTECSYAVKFRVFCDDHKRRGDCSIEDSDDNYVFEPYAPGAQS